MGKPAGIACVQLDADLRCKIFTSPLRPAVCGSLKPTAQMCASDRDAALTWLLALECATAPD